MSSKTQSSVEKAKKTGVKKKFYITSPSGWALVEVLPKIDMAARMATNAFAFQKLHLEEYKTQKDILREYIEGVELWTQEVFEQVVQNNKRSRFNLKMHNEEIKSSKFIYCNTEIGLDAYRGFAKCDTMNRCLIHALRYDVVSEDFYDQKSRNLLNVINNCKADVKNIVASLSQTATV